MCRYLLTINHAIQSTGSATILYPYTRQSYASVYYEEVEESIFHNIYANVANDLCLTISEWVRHKAQDEVDDED